MQKFATAVMVLSLLLFVPYQLHKFVMKYIPQGNQRQLVQAEVGKLGARKTLLFIHPRAIQQLIALNDPFLHEPVILLRDFGEKNPDALRTFPDHQPAYFRFDVQLSKGKMKGAYGVFYNPDKREPGQVSLFEVGMALETAQYYRDQDIFDFGYGEVFNRREAEAQWNYLQNESIIRSNQKNSYKDYFRLGIVHAARALLIPKKAFERFGRSWKKAMDTNAFRKELEQSEASFRSAGPVGQKIVTQIIKARIRMDKNRDNYLSDEEILTSWSQKRN